jgi:hypothetical protein
VGLRPDPSPVLFRVEQQDRNHWRVVAAGIEAGDHQQAVARGASAPGLHRAFDLGELEPDPRQFQVPEWGPPEAVKERGDLEPSGRE